MDDSARAEKMDAPSGPSMDISLCHMDFLSANGAKARHWQNTGSINMVKCLGQVLEYSG